MDNQKNNDQNGLTEAEIEISKMQFENIQKQEEGELNLEVLKLLGKEGYDQLSSSLRQIVGGFKHLVLTANEKGLLEKVPMGEDVPGSMLNLIKNLSNNLAGHAYGGTQNGNPKKLLNALIALEKEIKFG